MANEDRIDHVGRVVEKAAYVALTIVVLAVCGHGIWSLTRIPVLVA